jgi:hypothetical protein
MTLYREATEADDHGEFRDVVPVEPDYEAMMDAHDLDRREARRVWLAALGIGDNDDQT